MTKTDNGCGDVEGDGRWRWKANERAILGMGKKVRGGGREGKKAQEALRKKKGRMNKKDSNSVRDRQRKEGGWQRDGEVDVSGHFL